MKNVLARAVLGWAAISAIIIGLRPPPARTDPACELVRYIDDMRALINHDLSSEGLVQREGRLNREAKRVVPRAARLLAAVTRLLPATDRSRYAEEFQSELWDLAQDGAGRIRQLGYALHLLRNIVPMGFALRSPRRRGAAP